MKMISSLLTRSGSYSDFREKFTDVDCPDIRELSILALCVASLLPQLHLLRTTCFTTPKVVERSISVE